MAIKDQYVKMSELDQVLGRIREAMKVRGVDMTTLAQRLGKSTAWVSRILNKKRGMSIQVCLDIARVLEIDPASLFKDANNGAAKKSFEEYVREIVKDEMKKE